MKNLVICLLLVCIGLESCTKKQNDVNAAAAAIEKPISVQCYTALYEEDTINLKINTLKSGKISGKRNPEKASQNSSVPKASQDNSRQRNPEKASQDNSGQRNQENAGASQDSCGPKASQDSSGPRASQTCSHS